MLQQVEKNPEILDRKSSQYGKQRIAGNLMYFLWEQTDLQSFLALKIADDNIIAQIAFKRNKIFILLRSFL